MSELYGESPLSVCWVLIIIALNLMQVTLQFIKEFTGDIVQSYICMILIIDMNILFPFFLSSLFMMCGSLAFVVFLLFE